MGYGWTAAGLGVLEVWVAVQLSGWWVWWQSGLDSVCRWWIGLMLAKVLLIGRWWNFQRSRRQWYLELEYSLQGRFWIHGVGVGVGCWLGMIFGIGNTRRIHGGQSNSSNILILGLDLMSHLASYHVIVRGSHRSGIEGGSPPVRGGYLGSGAT